MKKNRILKLGLLALTLTLVTASLVSGTFAKYVTKLSGTDTVTVAKWNAVLTGPITTVESVEEFNFFTNYLSETGVAETGVKGVQLAPGTKGSFEFTYNTNGTEVAHNVTINLKQTEGTDLSNIDNLVISSTGGTTELTKANLETGVDIVNEDFTAASGGTTEAKTVTVNWIWPYGTGDVALDALDTEDGKTPIKDAVITATFTATQLDLKPVEP